MEDRNKLTVKIAGKEYTLVSDTPRDYMLEVADYVDQKMTELTNENNRLSTAMAALLVSLNIADDYLQLKREQEKSLQNIAECAERIEKLEREVSELRRPRPAAAESRTKSGPHTQQNRQ